MSRYLCACGGVDSSGAAGLDADRDAAEILGFPLRGVPTAWTEQDGGGVRAVKPVAGWWREVPATGPLKFGLLPGAEHIREAARLVREGTVVDPVIAASSGHLFLDEEALVELRGTLLAAGPIVTPNLPEARILTGREEPEAAARELIAMGARGVVVKGGHAQGREVSELVLTPGGSPRRLCHPRLAGTLRGSGCRFATALAIGLARGASLEAASMAAAALVAARLRLGSLPVGRACHPRRSG